MSHTQLTPVSLPHVSDVGVVDLTVVSEVGVMQPTLD